MAWMSRGRIAVGLVGLVVFAAIALARTSSSASGALCGAPETNDILFNVMAKTLANIKPLDANDLRKHFPELGVRLLHVITTDRDDKARQYTCTASLSLTVPAELFDLSVQVSARAKANFFDSGMNNALAFTALDGGRPSNSPHLMRMLMATIGNYPTATLEMPISYRSDMTDDGSEHYVTLNTDVSALLDFVLAEKLWDETPNLAREVEANMVK